MKVFEKEYVMEVSGLLKRKPPMGGFDAYSNTNFSRWIPSGVRNSKR
jgi:hypothetical protein